jgi:hypothetical protein
VVISFIFSRFGILDQEKSGNPVLNDEMQFARPFGFFYLHQDTFAATKCRSRFLSAFRKKAEILVPLLLKISRHDLLKRKLENAECKISAKKKK